MKITKEMKRRQLRKNGLEKNSEHPQIEHKTVKISQERHRL